jgi:hypothetical protein
MIGLQRHGNQYHESPVSTPPSGGSSERVDFPLMGLKPTVTLPNFAAFIPPDSPVCRFSIRFFSSARSACSPDQLPCKSSPLNRASHRTCIRDFRYDGPLLCFRFTQPQCPQRTSCGNTRHVASSDPVHPNFPAPHNGQRAWCRSDRCGSALILYSTIIGRLCLSADKGDEGQELHRTFPKNCGQYGLGGDFLFAGKLRFSIPGIS